MRAAFERDPPLATVPVPHRIRPPTSSAPSSRRRAPDAEGGQVGDPRMVPDVRLGGLIGDRQGAAPAVVQRSEDRHGQVRRRRPRGARRRTGRGVEPGQRRAVGEQDTGRGEPVTARVRRLPDPSRGASSNGSRATGRPRTAQQTSRRPLVHTSRIGSAGAAPGAAARTASRSPRASASRSSVEQGGRVRDGQLAAARVASPAQARYAVWPASCASSAWRPGRRIRDSRRHASEQAWTSELPTAAGRCDSVAASRPHGPGLLQRDEERWPAPPCRRR